MKKSIPEIFALKTMLCFVFTQKTSLQMSLERLDEIITELDTYTFREIEAALFVCVRDDKLFDVEWIKVIIESNKLNQQIKTTSAGETIQ